MPAIPSQAEIPSPIVFEANQDIFNLESTLDDLPQHQCQVELHHPGRELAQVFEQYPDLPGVVLTRQGQLVGMISRGRLLEYLIRPQGMELFLSQPLSVLYSYAHIRPMILLATTPILVAMQQALRRSPDQHNEPILVQHDAHTYRVLHVRDLHIASWQIRGIETQVRYERSQVQMIQTEKMAGLGRLVDGIAHEILDPVGFIWGNLTHVSTYTSQLLALVDAYEAALPQLSPHLQALQTDIELDYLKQDLPKTIDSIRAGADRLKQLVSSLQNFCHRDEVYTKPIDLHDCLDGILLLLKSRLTGKIQVTRQYGHLPLVNCFIGQLSQVLMNILTNAVDALINQAVQQTWAEQFSCSDPSLARLPAVPPQITITTEVRSHSHPADQPPTPATDPPSTCRWVSIRIANNGPALSPQLYQHLLESFSVANRAAKETSLALSYQIITANHGGQLYVRSPLVHSAQEPPNPIGTEFEILLPLVKG